MLDARPPLRVSVVSPFTCVRVGLTSLLQLEPDRAVVVETPTRCSVAARHVDVVLCDVAALAGEPLYGSRLLAGPAPVVVFARMADDPEPILAVAPETAVLREDLAQADLIAALERATGRETTAEATIAGLCLLTGRQADVIRLIASGYSNDGIARQLFISVNSVKSYIRTAYRIMGVQRRSEAVLWAIRHGLVPAPGVAVIEDDETGPAA